MQNNSGVHPQKDKLYIHAVEQYPPVDKDKLPFVGTWMNFTGNTGKEKIRHGVCTIGFHLSETGTGKPNL